MLVSVAIAVVAAELALRWVLFDSSLDVGAKDPAYYARDLDELWIYRQLFTNRGGWQIGSDRGEGTNASSIPFYRDWGASLVADAQLGYTRRANVRKPCHETTSIGTRAVHQYGPSGAKFIFFGDSFVESAACSDDTLTAKIEKATGVDTLNYGVGGYGLDQIVLAVERVLPLWDRNDCLFLVGLIPNDFERVLLKVRTAPKPYFTVDGAQLALHTDHIHPASLRDAFVRPPWRFYLLDLVRGRLGHPAYAAYLERTDAERRQRIETISRLLFERLSHDVSGRKMHLAYVLLPQPGASFDPVILESLKAQGLPIVDLRQCLRDSRRPDVDLYRELHPTSLGNDLLTDCMIHGLPSSRSP